jgi:hypothetical protein
MVGKMRGFNIHVKTIVLEITSSRCNIHRQPPAVKKIQKSFQNGVRQGCEHCKFYKLKTTELWKFLRTL